MRNQKNKNNYLLSQVLAYLSSGVFLIISHDLYNNHFLNYIGYLLLSTSIVILLSMLVSELVPNMQIHFGRNRRRILLFFKHSRRLVAGSLDETLSGVLPVITIMSISLGIFDELNWSHALPANNSANVVIPNFVSILVIVIAIFILYILVQQIAMLKRNWKIGLCAAGCIVVLVLTHIFQPSIFDLVFEGMMGVIIIFLVVIILKRRTNRNQRYNVLPINMVLILSSLVFFIAGLLAWTSGTPEIEKFFAPSLLLLYLASGLFLWFRAKGNPMSVATKCRLILLLLIGGAFFIMFAFFQINRYFIFGASTASIVSFLFP